MTDKPEAVAQWQRRPIYLQSFDPPGKVHLWQNCSADEATGQFGRAPGHEYRPLYAHPQPDASALVDALRKVMPIHVEDGPDYASVYFGDGTGTGHSTQAMTMNPQDWQDIAAALTAWEQANG